MKTSSVIEGLQIITKDDKGDCCDIYASHDVLYISSPSEPIGIKDLKRLQELGWFQDHPDEVDEWTVEYYNPEEGFSCYT